MRPRTGSASQVFRIRKAPKADVAWSVPSGPRSLHDCRINEFLRARIGRSFPNGRWRAGVTRQTTMEMPANWKGRKGEPHVGTLTDEIETLGVIPIVVDESDGNRTPKDLEGITVLVRGYRS